MGPGYDAEERFGKISTQELQTLNPNIVKNIQ